MAETIKLEGSFLSVSICVSHIVERNDKQSRRTRTLELPPGFWSGEGVLFLPMENGNSLSIYSSPKRFQTLQTPCLALLHVRKHIQITYVLGCVPGRGCQELYIYIYFWLHSACDRYSLMVYFSVHLQLRVQMWIISEEGIILKSVGQLSIYKIHLRIAMCKSCQPQRRAQ